MSPRTVAALLLAAAIAPSARAADLNVITSVDVKDEGATVVLSIRGSKKPSFTTFSMAEPPRFVIDFSESKFDGVPETVQVGDGTINVVKNLSYGSDATSIARVMVAFAAEVPPPEVADVGETLVVRVAKPAGAAVAQAAPADDGKAAAAAAAAAEEKARADREARAETDARAKAEADARAKAESDARAKAEAEEEARAEEQARAKADADRAARSEAERVATTAAAAAAAAEAADQRAKEDRARADQEAQAKAEEQRRTEEAAAERAESERQAKDREAERRKAEAVAAAKVADDPVEAAAPAAPSRLEAGAPAAKLREVGFKQLAGASRVFVRTSVTPKFTIQELGDGTIRLELENTRVERRNDLRFMDTSFFPSAVAMVAPGKHGTSYVLDIKLRQRVPYQQRIEGDVLAIDFERPAGAGAAPHAAAADEAAPAGEEPLPAAEDAPEAGATP